MVDNTRYVCDKGHEAYKFSEEHSGCSTCSGPVKLYPLEYNKSEVKDTSSDGRMVLLVSPSGYIWRPA